ncbi:MAG: hypothetical protein LC623_06700 [Halobacteriales archaeon]|nr:hypothetical protein [Halobacteriales archaeon]
MGGNTLTFTVATTAQGNTYFQFIPDSCLDSNVFAEWATMYVRGDSVTTDCVGVLAFINAPARTYTVDLKGDFTFIGQTVVANYLAMHYRLIVHQSSCV